MKKLVILLAMTLTLLGSSIGVHAAAPAGGSATKAAPGASQSTLKKVTPQATADTAPAKKVVTGTNFLSKVETAVLKKLNQERAAQGLGELVYNEDLCSAARIRSRELYKNDYFAHERPNGDGWETVIKEDIPITFVAAGENLCMTEYNDPDNHTAKSASFWVDQWINSPAHYDNIVRPNFNSAGVGIYCIEKNGVTYAYATTVFAEIKP